MSIWLFVFVLLLLLTAELWSLVPSCCANEALAFDFWSDDDGSDASLGVCVAAAAAAEEDENDGNKDVEGAKLVVYDLISTCFFP